MYENQMYAYPGGSEKMNLTAVDTEKSMTWTSRYLEFRIKELKQKIEKLDEKRDRCLQELQELSSCMGEIKHFEQMAFPLKSA